MLAPDMMNFVQSTMNLDDYSERNYGVAHVPRGGEKNNSSTRLCSCTRSQVAPRLVLNLNFTVLSLFSSLEEDDDALDPFKLEV